MLSFCSKLLLQDNQLWPWSYRPKRTPARGEAGADVIPKAMDAEFAALIAGLPASLEALLACPPHTGGGPLPMGTPDRAVYLFSEGDRYFSVGRTNRLRNRYREHCRQRHNDAPFAFKLARIESGHLKAKGGLSRSALECDEVFAAEFLKAKERVKRMEFRWVEEVDPNRQCLLEIYATLSLKALHNDFENH